MTRPTTQSHMKPSFALEEKLATVPVLPVVTIDDAANAVPLARALLSGGITAIEITLRTSAALEAISLLATQLPDMFVGAGTVLSPKDLHACADAGAAFAVSPGATPALLSASRGASIPLLPGVATASDIMQGIEHGLRFFKLFPANVAGGIDALRGFAGPFSNVRFCPTGGINIDTAESYLALSNVVCVGGSWLTPAKAIQSQDWPAIESLARQAMGKLTRPRLG